MSLKEFKVRLSSWALVPDPCPAFPNLSGSASITFVVVILHREDPALGSSGTVKNELSVQRLDGEGVQYTDVDLLCEGRRPRC
jgi:hypothetical protein